MLFCTDTDPTPTQQPPQPIALAANLGYKDLVEHLYWDLGPTAGGAVFEVSLRGSTARVCLMDADEYRAYCDEGVYEFHGGFVDESPVIMETPWDDHWVLVIDSYERVTVKVDQIFD